MNFRITTDYILQIFNDTTQSYHSIWIGERNGKYCIEVAADSDTTSVALDWNYANQQLPNPSKEQQATSNYRITEFQSLQLLNPTSGKYHTINITFSKNNPLFNVGEGED